MSSQIRVVLMTGNERRHRYVAETLARELNIVGVVREAKPPVVSTTAEVGEDDRRVMDAHLGQRHAAELKLLGDPIAPSVEELEVPHGQSNTPSVLEWVSRMSPDFVLLYGTSIIRPPLLTKYEGRMINMHLGLSPYYRGTATNFWPLVNGEPECVGATLHLAISAVDAGAILAQVRPECLPADGAHELGTRTIQAGANLWPRVLDMYQRGHITPAKQDLSGGRVYRRRDFNAGAVRTLWERLEHGMMGSYAADREARHARVPIVTA